MLSARQPPLGLSVTSWPLGSLNFTLSQFANSLFGDAWYMFCKKLILIWLRYFRYLEKKKIYLAKGQIGDIWDIFANIWLEIFWDIWGILKWVTIVMRYLLDICFVFVGVCLESYLLMSSFEKYFSCPFERYQMLISLKICC